MRWVTAAVLLGLGLGVGRAVHAQANRLEAMLVPGGFSGGLGVNAHFNGNYRHDIERIAASGFKVVRTDLLWARVETERGRYDWHVSDQLLRDLKLHRLTPLFILAYSNPLYAPRVPGRPNSDSLAYAAPRDAASQAAFMAFARAAARRYGKDTIWEVWNEPDHNFGSPVDLRGYIEFAGEVCRQVREVRSDATVIGPAASGFLQWFLEAFIKADDGQCFDAVSVHPYRDWAPEDVLKDWQRTRAMLPACVPGGSCPTLADSEWGYSVTGGEWTAQRQAEFVVRLRLLDIMSKVPLTVIYDWRNDGSEPGDKEANFGLNDFFGAPKPVLNVLESMNRELGDFRYMGRVVTDRPGDFVLAFGADGAVRKLVGWTASAHDSEVKLTDATCVDAGLAFDGRAFDGGAFDSGRVVAACGPNGFALRTSEIVRLSAAPRVLLTRNDRAGENPRRMDRQPDSQTMKAFGPGENQ